MPGSVGFHSLCAPANALRLPLAQGLVERRLRSFLALVSRPAVCLAPARLSRYVCVFGWSGPSSGAAHFGFGIHGEAEAEHEHCDAGGDRLPEPARRALVSLLMHRYVSKTRNRMAWDGILTYENDLRARLDEIYLDLVVDHETEVAFKRQQDGDDIPRMLRREKAAESPSPKASARDGLRPSARRVTIGTALSAWSRR
jgi:Domain of unknown function (DUF4194)